MLFRRLISKKNAHGISVRAQVLYLIVFVVRYLDLFTTYYSFYNTLMKIFYISSTAAIIGAIYCYEPLRDTCDLARDTFSHWKLLVVPSFLFAMIVHIVGSQYSYNGFDFMELLWTFSICLEPVAILPQLFLIFRYREIDTILWIYEYILFKGIYRAFYILNWIYRSLVEPHYKHHFLVYACGVLQTLVYADFLLFYCKRKSLIRWMALRNVDTEYVDGEEEYQNGGQFELLLEEDGMLIEEETAACSSSKIESSAASQRGASTNASNVKDGFITILE